MSGLAVTQGNARLYVTGFLSFTRTGGKQGDDGKEDLFCHLDIDTNLDQIRDYWPMSVIPLAARVAGFS